MYTFETWDNFYLAYLAAPRTASKATARALMGIGFERVGEHHNIDAFDPVAMSAITTVRNHYDTIASFWELDSTHIRFDRWLPTFLEGSPYITRTDGGPRLFGYAALAGVRILRYENLLEDLNDFLVEYGVEKVTLSQVGKKKPKPYQLYYNSRTSVMVSQYFSTELKEFDYKY